MTVWHCMTSDLIVQHIYRRDSIIEILNIFINEQVLFLVQKLMWHYLQLILDFKRDSEVWLYQ